MLPSVLVLELLHETLPMVPYRSNGVRGFSAPLTARNSELEAPVDVERKAAEKWERVLARV